jgi:hypothetical protein
MPQHKTIENKSFSSSLIVGVNIIMQEHKKPSCFICGRDDFDTYTELAQHVVSNRITHGKSIKWALRFLANADYLNKKVDKPQSRAPLTEEELASKEQSRRLLCGQERIVSVVCPHCKGIRSERVPIEHISNPTAWKIKGRLAISCEECTNKSRTKMFASAIR